MRFRKFFQLTMFAWVVGASAFAANAQSMRFRFAPVGEPDECSSECPVVIVGEGEIGRGTARAFAAIHKRSAGEPKFRNMLLIHSIGGIVAGGLDFGSAVRRTGATVVVARVGRAGGGLLNGVCSSTCVYVLMGGRERVVPDESSVAVHRVFALGERNAFSGFGYQPPPGAPASLIVKLRRYASRMGVDPYIVDLGEMTPPGGDRVLAPNEIEQLRLARRRL